MRASRAARIMKTPRAMWMCEQFFRICENVCANLFLFMLLAIIEEKKIKKKELKQTLNQ